MKTSNQVTRSHSHSTRTHSSRTMFSQRNSISHYLQKVWYSTIFEPLHEKPCFLQGQIRLEIWDLEVEEFYYLCSENKSADQLSGNCLCFCIYKSRFSHEAAHVHVCCSG